mgnify:CR=1 FL=1|jgi:hypothetical protein|nr:MAG TPA: hypothetical protein [Caudoviricetes sp.]
MAIAGRVAIVPKGDWSADATYKRLDAVTYNNTLYFAKKEVPAGTATSNTEYWSKSIVGSASAIATTEDAGVVKPDGKSMSVDESGTLSINLDGTTITLDEAKNVIKLADTLKDRIGSALQPESIVNNQITTVEGFALDARQANPNLDGTLAKQVADLNGSLNDLNNFKFRKIIDNWSSASQVSDGCGIYRIGTIEDNFYSSIAKNIKIFQNVGDYSLIIFSWNGLETLRFGAGLLTSPRSTTISLVQVWEGVFILYDI